MANQKGKAAAEPNWDFFYAVVSIEAIVYLVREMGWLALIAVVGAAAWAFIRKALRDEA